MANGDAQYLWADHDRWVHEVFVPHAQEEIVARNELRRKQDRLDSLIIKAVVTLGSTLFLVLGGVAANLWVALAHH